ncbi:response regulator transcription factor [Thioalkalivibrio thiocyanodenitrificans]|uniref:response regulator transcription factor n=1 Tax=Thioalkalivibrio thiocyanodenitrificans TaxID=243063 RepID=UPI00036A83E3|nr:response regulator transcription factor [Thioalkalivibrio thiocyanodenitrificans]
MSSLERPEPQPIRVLLVCDLAIVAWGLERLVGERESGLALAGSAATPTDARSLLDTQAPDVVLIDVDGDHGPDTVGELAAGHRAKVLALTGARDAATHEDMMLAGASGVVHKSDAVATLLKAIHRVHEGELWANRAAIGRVFDRLSRRKAVPAAGPEQLKIAQLTRKERQVVAEIARDASTTSEEIAERLHISRHTLRNHLTTIYGKLEVSGRLALFVYAHRHGLAEAEPAPPGGHRRAG